MGNIQDIKPWYIQYASQLFDLLKVIVGAVLGLIAAKKGMQWQHEWEVKREHHKEIKKAILIPIIKYINENIIPVLERKQCLIRKVVNDVIVTIDFPPEKLDKVLYDDLKNHYSKLFERLEKLKQDFAGYSIKVLEFTEYLQSRIRKEIIDDMRIPESNYAAFENKGFSCFIDPKPTSIYASGIEDINLFLTQDNYLVLSNEIYIAFGTKEQMEKCQTKIEQIKQSEQPESAKLKSMNDLLLEEFDLLLKDLQRLNKRPRLQGNCEFNKI